MEASYSASNTHSHQQLGAYVINLKFPGEQGKTGKLQVSLISR